MDEWKEATPVWYLDRGIGRTFVSVSKGPALLVRERQPEDSEREPSICIEFEDGLKVASKQLGLSPDDEEEILRVCLHLSSARKLCVHLIHALASSGDTVANRIQHMMRQAMDSLENED